MSETISVGDLLVRIGRDVRGLLDAARRGTDALASMDTAGSRMALGIRNSTLLTIGAVAAMAKALDTAITASIA